MLFAWSQFALQIFILETNGISSLVWPASRIELEFFHLVDTIKDSILIKNMMLTMIEFYGGVSVLWFMKSLICLESDIVFITIVLWMDPIICNSPIVDLWNFVLFVSENFSRISSLTYLKDIKNYISSFNSMVIKVERNFKSISKL